MKKTVIITILIAYLASILIVQFFGLKVVEMTGNTYITDIEISNPGFEFTNRGDDVEDKYKQVKKLKNSSGDGNDYYGYFIYGAEKYDKSPESLSANPNRVKVLYNVRPYNATHKKLTYSFDNNAYENIVYFDEETEEFVFLQAWTIDVTLSSNDGSMIRKTLSISLV